MVAEICIIGDGYSSAVLLLNLAKKKFDLKKIVVIGPKKLGAGQAFATHDSDYRLNGPADRVNLFNDARFDFLNWAQKNIVDVQAETKIGKFYKRQDFAKYLTYKLRSLKNYSDINQIGEIAENIDFKDGKGQILLSDGNIITANTVIMATGNATPTWPFQVAGKNKNLIEQPWCQTWKKNIKSNSVVAILGSGLTALDAIHELNQINFSGEIMVVSPKGLLPGVHIGWYPPKKIEWPKNLNSLLFYKFMHQKLRNLSWNDPEWQRVFDGLREGISDAWINLSPNDRRKLMKNFGWLWQLMRFRSSPQVAKSLSNFLNKGKIQIIKNKATHLEKISDEKFLIKLKNGESLDANFVINCTGASQNKLIKNLITRNFIKADKAFPFHPKINNNLEVATTVSHPFFKLFAVGPPTAHFCGDVIGATKIARQAEKLVNILKKH